MGKKFIRWGIPGTGTVPVWSMRWASKWLNHEVDGGWQFWEISIYPFGLQGTSTMTKHWVLAFEAAFCIGWIGCWSWLLLPWILPLLADWQTWAQKLNYRSATITTNSQEACNTNPKSWEFYFSPQFHTYEENVWKHMATYTEITDIVCWK